MNANNTDRCAFAPLLTSGNLPCLSCKAPVATKNKTIIKDVKITNWNPQETNSLYKGRPNTYLETSAWNTGSVTPKDCWFKNSKTCSHN